MKIGRILFLMSALAFSQAGMANHQASDKNSAADKMWDKLTDFYDQTPWWEYADHQVSTGRYPKYW